MDVSKGKHTAECSLRTHPIGGELRLEAEGEFQRGEAGRDGFALIDLSEGKWAGRHFPGASFAWAMVPGGAAMSPRGLGLVVLAATLLLPSPCSADPISVDQSYIPSPPPDGFIIEATQTVAQTFTVGLSGMLTALDLELGCCRFGPPSDDLLVEVRSTLSDGFPSNQVLASTVLHPADIPVDSFAFVRAALGPHGFSVSPGELLSIVLSSSAPSLEGGGVPNRTPGSLPMAPAPMIAGPLSSSGKRIPSRWDGHGIQNLCRSQRGARAARPPVTRRLTTDAVCSPKPEFPESHLRLSGTTAPSFRVPSYEGI